MSKKKKIYKVGIDSETYAISLVESPAIEETLVALEEQKPIKIQLADEEKYMVYSAVLVPDKPIYRRNEDGDEFYIEFTKESIEKMSQEYLMNYRQNEITLDHSTMANDITLVESWIKTDMYKDKSVAIGLSEDLPIGTWIAGLKVNQIDAWNRIKNGELKGFSVESMISLEEFSKNDNNMIETNDEMFWSKLKNVMNDIFASMRMEDRKADEPKDEEVELEEQEPSVEPQNEPTVEPQEAPKEEEVVETKEEPIEEPTEPKNEPQEEPKDDNTKHLEELINSMKEEIKALKDLNSGLNDKVKALEATPSAKPISTVAKPSVNSGIESDTYQAWREKMRQMI